MITIGNVGQICIGSIPNLQKYMPSRRLGTLLYTPSAPSRLLLLALD